MELYETYNVLLFLTEIFNISILDFYNNNNCIRFANSIIQNFKKIRKLVIFININYNYS